MTSQQLIILCGVGWAIAVVVLIALDALGSNWPKKRFQPRGWYLPRPVRERFGFRRKIRTVQDEQVRQTLEAATGRPTLALSQKRLAKVRGRQDLFVTATIPSPTSPAPADRSEAWRHLVDSGWERENRDRIRAGLPPERWNPIRNELETADILDDGTTLLIDWPEPT